MGIFLFWYSNSDYSTGGRRRRGLFYDDGEAVGKYRRGLFYNDEEVESNDGSVVKR